MRLAVCEASAQLLPGGEAWQALTEGSQALSPDLFLLNEMPFGPWISAKPEPKRAQLLTSHRLHDEGLERLADLGAPRVLVTRPSFEDDRSVNEALAWDARGVRSLHTKQFFPDEAGYYEARWFERGELRFETADFRGVTVGFLTCTDVMFNEWARFYGRRGAHLIAVPRSTPPGSSVERWKTAVSMAAVVSGCYVASSNRSGVDEYGQEFGGCGWIFDPNGGLIAETSSEEPVVAADIDPALADEAKHDYPRYVQDLPTSQSVRPGTIA